jgi:hypothetical protein
MQGRAKEHRSDRFPRTRPSRPPTRSGGQGQRSNVAIGYTTQGTSSIHDRRRSRTHPAEVQWLFQSTCSIGLFRRGPFSGRGRGRTNKTAVGRPRSAVSGEKTLTPHNSGRHGHPPSRAAPTPKDTAIASCVSRAEEGCAAGAGRTPVPPHALSHSLLAHPGVLGRRVAAPHSRTPTCNCPTPKGRSLSRSKKYVNGSHSERPRPSRWPRTKEGGSRRIFLKAAEAPGLYRLCHPAWRFLDSPDSGRGARNDRFLQMCFPGSA